MSELSEYLESLERDPLSADVEELKASVAQAAAALRAGISGATDGDQQLPIAAGSYQCDGQGEEGRP